MLLAFQGAKGSRGDRGFEVSALFAACVLLPTPYCMYMSTLALKSCLCLKESIDPALSLALTEIFGLADTSGAKFYLSLTAYSIQDKNILDSSGIPTKTNSTVA